MPNGEFKKIANGVGIVVSLLVESVKLVGIVVVGVVFVVCSILTSNSYEARRARAAVRGLPWVS